MGGAEIARETELQVWQHRIKIFYFLFYDASIAEREVPTQRALLYDLNLS